jgi:uncharacterized protein YndB with AHSA1/START domain
MSTEPIRRSVAVRRSVEDAFRIFTAELGTWWPLETHSRAASDFEGEDVKVERVAFPSVAGEEVVEHMSNGVVLPWGRIIELDPPHRFVMAWKPHSRPTPPTEVEVRFTPEGDGTRVELEHRGWERLGPDVAPVRLDYAAGWGETLARFAARANEEVA